MNLQTRKLQFLHEFMQLNNEQVIFKLESVLRNERSKLTKEDFIPYSLDELNSMIDSAENDVIKNNFIEANQLKEEIRKWK